MAKTNVRNTFQEKTYEGASASRITPELALRRSVMSCMLFESEFYEDGVTIADRISELVSQVSPEKVQQIAIDARNKMKLRHVPLWIVRQMARLDTHKHLVADTLFEVLQRADEPAEFLSLYWKDGRQTVSAQVKKGIARAFRDKGWDEYQLGKWNRDGHVKMKDALFISHPKPKDEAQAALWKKLVDGTLATPDTWETAISSTKGEGKKEQWERLLQEKKLGILALIRNLRNFSECGVNDDLIRERLSDTNPEKALPFRFIAAARYAPRFEPELETAMLKCLSSQEKLSGHTVLLVDVSSSMHANVSGKSEITRMDAACGVGMLLREIAEKVDVYTFSMKLYQVPPRHGFALRDAIVNSQEHSGTPLGLAVESIYGDGTFKDAHFGSYGTHPVKYTGQRLRPDRLIVITDEQSADNVPNPIGKGYMVNVASAKNGVGYGAWNHVDGWSEAVVDYIRQYEKSGLS